MPYTIYTSFQNYNHQEENMEKLKFQEIIFRKYIQS